MSDFELWDTAKGPDVSFHVAPVSFPAFEVYKAQAQMVAAYIGSLEVTEDNVKDVRKELAKCRKVTEELKRRRIDIKNRILEEYGIFEGQVKELTGIVDAADSELRQKVRAMEERERQDKRERIHEIWEKRVGLYKVGKLAKDEAFESFLTPQHLNKTTSMKSVEKEMVAWLEQTEKDLDALAAMGQEYEAEYLTCFNLGLTISVVNARHQREQLVRQDHEEDAPEVAVFRVYGTKDIALTRALLKANDINFKE